MKYKEKNNKLTYCCTWVDVQSKKHTLTHSWYTSNNALHSSFVFPFRNFSENHLLKHASYFSLSSWHSGLMLFILSGGSSNVSTRSQSQGWWNNMLYFSPEVPNNNHVFYSFAKIVCRKIVFLAELYRKIQLKNI